MLSLTQFNFYVQDFVFYGIIEDKNYLQALNSKFKKDPLLWYEAGKNSLKEVTSNYI